MINIKDPRVIIATASVVSAAAGAVGGYIYASKKLLKEFDQRMIAELETTREHYARIYKKDEFSDISKLAKDESPEPDEEEEFSTSPHTRDQLIEATEKIQELKYGSHPAFVVDRSDYKPDPEVVKNIFDAKPVSADEFEWDYGEELRARSTMNPYVIHHDEWTDAELGHDQFFLTYYVVDNVLADDADIEVDDIEYTVGADNLDRFGHGSGDKNIVYIRNERTGVDYEVTYDPGSFENKVVEAEDRESKGPGSIRQPRSDHE